MTKLFKVLIMTLVAVLLLGTAAGAGEYTYSIELTVTVTIYNTYYGGPLDPDGMGTTYLAGTEPEYVVHDDGTWEIIGGTEK